MACFERTITRLRGHLAAEPERLDLTDELLELRAPREYPNLQNKAK